MLLEVVGSNDDYDVGPNETVEVVFDFQDHLGNAGLNAFPQGPMEIALVPWGQRLSH